MKIEEFKNKAINGLNNMIDLYFGENNIQDKFINITLKHIIKQNKNKFDNVLELFADENNDIDVNNIINSYSTLFNDDGLILDVRNWIKNNTIKSFIPDKALKIKKEDIINIFR